MSSFGTVFRHPPPCHDFLMDSVSLPSAFRLGRVTCLGQWGDKKCQQRLETCFCDYTRCLVLLSLSWHTPALAHLLVQRDWEMCGIDLNPASSLEQSVALEQWSQPFRHQGLALWKTVFPQKEGGEMVSGWFKHIMFNWVLHFYYYYISSSDHQEFNPRGWGPLVQFTYQSPLTLHLY